VHFDSLSGLWFGLSLPAIVLLYLFKRKYVDMLISSHMLWNRVLKDMEANRPWQKLRSRLLMLVQLLVAALLVLAIMQPWVWSHRSAKARVVVVLDRSASMTAVTAMADGATESRLDRAKREIADWAGSDGKNSAITLLAMGEQADVLLSQETDRSRLREALNQVEPAYGKTAYKEAMSLAAALTRSDPDSEIRLFTDGQFAEPVTGLSFAVPVTVHRVDDTSAESNGNVSIAQFGVKSVQSTDGFVAAVASVQNWGTAPRQVEVSLYAGNELADVKTVHVESGKQAAVVFEQVQPADGYKLDIGSGDSLLADNVSYAFLEGVRPRNVLLIGNGNLFLEKALTISGAEVTLLAPDNAAAWIHSQKTDGGPDLIVIDSVSEGTLDTDEWSGMLAARPVWYIRSGYDGKEIPTPAGAYTIEDHPVTRYLKFQETHVASVWQPIGLGWGKPVVSANGVPLLYAGTENGQPRLLLAFSLQQSDLPLRAEFPVFVQNALGWLTAAHGESLGRAVAGERIEIAMSPAAASAVWVNAEQEQQVLAADKTSGTLSSNQTIPSAPGLYRLEEKDDSGQTVQVRSLGITADARESGNPRPGLNFGLGADAGAGGEAEASGTAEATGQSAASAPAGQEDERQGAPLALWRWIVVLVLAAVVWEWGVYRRGTSV